MRARFAQTTIYAEIEKATDKAVLVKLDDGTKKWEPRSVCLDGDSLSVGDDDLIVADWWLEQEGIG